ncbi:MAG: hypothetical protein H6617_09360 [Bdellovibrionaceae bacterium]|nr:hypothetical protein [Pseudobdellovibrionaceae bacterium]
MKHKLIGFTLVLAITVLAGCGKSGEFDYLFDPPNQPGGTPSNIQGLWRLDSSTASQEVRAEVGSDYVVLAGKCTLQGQTVIVGKKVSATVNSDSIDIKEAVNEDKREGNVLCSLSIPAMSYDLQNNRGRAQLRRIGVSFTKLLDLKDLKK